MPAIATKLSVQLQAIKSAVEVDSQPLRRPYTRPSVIFDSKEAADINLETVFTVAVSGLEVLISSDKRFEAFRGTIFNQKSLEFDRELVGIAENDEINASISVFLRLLSGYVHLHAALKALEYLIRRYKVHVYNVDDLVLCALPHHDTHAFVRIVQLLHLSKRWGFLEAVKSTGAPLPRNVIVQQCTRDMGVLDALCNYAISSKNFEPSCAVTHFCTAVIFEVLGSIPALDTDTVKRILPFVFDGLTPSEKRRRPDHEAGSLMIVGILATRAALRAKLVNNLIVMIARVARQDANHSEDLSLLRMSLMAIISLVQLQPHETFPKKALEHLKDIGEVSGVLVGLTKEFKLEHFLVIYLEALTEFSMSDSGLRPLLVRTIEMIPVKHLICIVVGKVLKTCMKLSQSKEKSFLRESASWARQIFSTVNKHYSRELRDVIQKYLEDKQTCYKQDTVFGVLGSFFDGSMDTPLDISHLNIWFSLDHPRAEVRQSALLNMAASTLIKANTIGSQDRIIFEDAILRRFQDDDLNVVQAALSAGLSNNVLPSRFLKPLHDVLFRCVEILTGSSCISSHACDVALLSLDYAISVFKQHTHDCLKLIITMLFPLLLILPKTWRLNVKVLKLVREVHWPVYASLHHASDCLSTLLLKKFENDHATSINLMVVASLSSSVLVNDEVQMHWMIECCQMIKLSKPIFFLILLHIVTGESGRCVRMFKACFPFLKKEWCEMELHEDDLVEEWENDFSDDTCMGIIRQLSNWKIPPLGSNILLFLLRSLMKAALTMNWHLTSADNDERLQMFKDLFVFFSSSSLKKFLVKELCNFALRSSASVVQFLFIFFTEEGYSAMVQITSLSCLVIISSKISEKYVANSSEQMQLLLGFPRVLVPLASDNQDIRIAALDCIDSLHNLSKCIEYSEFKNGYDTLACTSWTPAFCDFLSLIVDQRKLISSDASFFPSFFMSALSCSSQSSLLSQSFGTRFDQCTKDMTLNFILRSALSLPAYGMFTLLSLVRRVADALFKVADVELILRELLDRRMMCHIGNNQSFHRLSQVELEILCLLLAGFTASSVPSSISDSIMDCIFTALVVDHASLEDQVVAIPCVTILRNLPSGFYDRLTAKMQDQVFFKLVILSRCNDMDIQSAAKEALLHVNVTCSTVCKLFDVIFANEQSQLWLDNRAKKKKATRICDEVPLDLLNVNGNMQTLVGALLDILLLRNDIDNRASLIEPLFQLLQKMPRDNWEKQGHEGIKDSVIYIKQTALMVMEEIITSLSGDDIMKKLLDGNHVKQLVQFSYFVEDATTRNHIFSLLSTTAKVIPDSVLQHFSDILTVIGKFITSEIDHDSYHAFETLMSTIIPCWLSKAGSVEKLLQVFVDALPEIAEHWRLNLVVYLLRVLGEEEGLSYLLSLLFRSLIRRIKKPTTERDLGMLPHLLSARYKEWEYKFALQVCDQCPCFTWLSSLVLLFERISENRDEELVAEFLLAVHLAQEKLQDTDLAFLIEAGQEEDILQRILGELMGQIVCKMHLVTTQRKVMKIVFSIREVVKGCVNGTLETMLRRMTPIAYFRAITSLLDNSDKNVRKKTLGLLCAAARDSCFTKQDSKGRRLAWNLLNSDSHMDENIQVVFSEMCLKIIDLIISSEEESAVKLAGVSVLEELPRKFPSDTSLYVTCLASVVRGICSYNLSISSASLRSTAALVQVLGIRALPELPNIMHYTLERAQWVSSYLIAESKASDRACKMLLLSIFDTLDAVVGKLGGFLNPYLEDIMELMVLHTKYYSDSCANQSQKVDALCKLLAEKVPARLVLPPVMKIYTEAVNHGQLSILQVFKMLACVVQVMDKSSVRCHHVAILDHCLQALDLRWQNLASVQGVYVVEESVIHVMVTLVMKLTETMFKPFFIRSLEWAEDGCGYGGPSGSKNLGRVISFYKLINKLCEAQRSLFVPYFKYLSESCVQYLTHGQRSSSPPKQKRVRVQKVATEAEGQGEFSIAEWHLRALILSCLEKCFRYDTGNLKFLDSSKFQILLKPIVAQLVMEAPASLEQFPDVPGVDEVDDAITSCLSHMALTAGTDVLWKPLNHEVLMQTRSEKIRPRILGLRVVKSLVACLREEYIVLLAETVPFLSELLEDVERPVKSLAQEILKELEILSGENIRAYL